MAISQELSASVEHAEDNPYLVGVYAPVHTEITADDLEIVGTIPKDLDGVFVRTGPNPQYEPQGRYHWFDGDGMLHAIRFADGRASYRNRWVRTKAFQKEARAGRTLWTGVMEHPGGNEAVNRKGLPLKDTANTSVHYHNGKVLALWYLAGEPYAVDPHTLDTIGVETFDGTLQCDMSAHAKVDERTGELFFFDYGPRPPYLRYGVVDAGGRVTHCVDIDLPGARMPHDMAITDSYAILMDLPLYRDPEAAREGRHKIIFDRELPSRFAVIPRRGTGSEVRWFEASPCYIYHIINAFEDGPEVVLDVCSVSRPQPIGSGNPLARMLSYLRLDAHLHRYRFNVRTGGTREERRDDDNTEFPAIPTHLTGRRSRYAYNVHISPKETLLFDGLVKYDLTTGTSERYAFGEGRWGSETPFALRPGAVAEDDGYLVSFVQDEREGRSEVVILDAGDIAAGPVGRVLLPQRVPIGFHATWVRGDQLPKGPS
ncbi:MAG: 9-cis-epoxycarotenoid dioxygenase [Streptosporangiales bacterium]|nr:9-cis-epoxycarotenoid dioxygenase [Streptosporangiales bacterium]